MSSDAPANGLYRLFFDRACGFLPVPLWSKDVLERFLSSPATEFTRNEQMKVYKSFQPKEDLITDWLQSCGNIHFIENPALSPFPRGKQAHAELKAWMHMQLEEQQWRKTEAARSKRTVCHCFRSIIEPEPSETHSAGSYLDDSLSSNKQILESACSVVCV